MTNILTFLQTLLITPHGNISSKYLLKKNFYQNNKNFLIDQIHLITTIECTERCEEPKNEREWRKIYAQR